MDITAEVLEIEQELISFRTWLHQCPETAYEEVETTKWIQGKLDSWGISYEKLNPTGLIGTIGNGKHTIALRADIDALEVTEDTNLPFASKRDGFMHACGHDGHMAILLGAAKILKKHEEELDKKVLLIFQPAEEIALGAKKIVDSGVLDEVEEIFGLHIFSGIEAGKISIEEGPRMAATDWFTIEIEGKAGHAGKPHLCVDATVVAASMVMNLQTIVSRQNNPLDPLVITVGHLESGTARNVISGYAKLEGTARTFSEEVEEKARESIVKTARETGKMYGANVTIDYPKTSHGPLKNDKDMVEKIKKGADKIFDKEDFVHVPPMMLGEDFANYLTQIKGAFAFVGGGGEYPNHHSKFDMDSKSLLNGLKLMLAYVLEP
ncbi:MAG: amidohydrolase [Anaerostipes sp.]|nr:amidohydrolase [Anaerostipes sp.]